MIASRPGRFAASTLALIISRSASTLTPSMRAEPLHGRGQAGAVVARGAGEQRLGQQLGLGRVRRPGRQERDPQPQLDQRHPGLADGQHPQARVETSARTGAASWPAAAR